MTKHKIKDKIGRKMTERKAYKKKRVFFSFLIFFFFSFLFPGNSGKGVLFAQDKIVAVVNNDIISENDLDDFVNFMRMQMDPQAKDTGTAIQELKADSLNKLIEDKLILQEAKKYNIIVDESRVQGRIAEIKRAYPSETEFQRALNSQGIVQADLEEKIREQLLMYNIIDDKIRRNIVINPVEVTEFYQERIDEFKLSEQREFKSITVNDGNLAKDISVRLRSSQDIQGIIEENSLTVSDLTAMRDGRLRKEVEDVIFSLELGEVSKPIEFNGVYYVLKLEKIIPSRQQPLSEVKDKIYSFLQNSKMQEELYRWLDELKKQAYIKIL